MIGRTLGHYEIVALIGRGGMGEVYRARDTKLDRDVALKVLPADVANDATRLERFRREAKTVAGLNSPHIVTLYSVEEDAGDPQNSSCLGNTPVLIVFSVVSAVKPRRSRGLRAAEGPGELGLADYIGHAQKEVIQ